VESWSERVAVELEAIRWADRWRQPVDLDAVDAVSGTVGGRRMVSFASNDYLGLTRHPAVVAAAHDALDRWGSGTGAARLVVGSRPIHGELEAALARWKASEDAVLFPTGFAANLGVLTAFGGADATVLSDELNHASIIDGSRLARAQVRVYRHRDLDHLADHLADCPGPTIVVTDTVFSMDGDCVDLDGLVELTARHGALLVLDEAHAVLGPDLPFGPLEAGLPILRVGTLSKTLGSLGGFVAGPRGFVDLLRNTARSFIFTTASSPADTAAALAALGVLQSDEGAALRTRLRRHIDRLCPGHPSPVLPVLLGLETAARRAAASLADRGLLVPAIRPPTVPPGTSRLRVALSAAHNDAQVGALLAGLDEVVPGGLAAIRTGGPALQPDMTVSAEPRLCAGGGGVGYPDMTVSAEPRLCAGGGGVGPEG
jgi:8-amino-7-oxononanoate synthase